MQRLRRGESCSGPCGIGFQLKYCQSYIQLQGTNVSWELENRVLEYRGGELLVFVVLGIDPRIFSEFFFFKVYSFFCLF